jgi:hypothetical protein
VVGLLQPREGPVSIHAPFLMAAVERSVRSSNSNKIPSRSPGTSEFAFRASEHALHMNLVILESCHSTWIFDSRQLRFCRILNGIEVRHRRISTAWRPYWDLEIDPGGESFTVFLDEARTRLIRSSRHSEGCTECGGYETTELSLEDIHRAVA